VPSEQSHPEPRRPLVDGEFPLTYRDFKRIAEILRTDIGIVMVEAKAPLVYSRLVKRLRHLGLKNFQDYCLLITSSNGKIERREMLAALTTNVTSFFRENHHFDHLKNDVLPALLDKARRGERVRIWSAGCSSGMEPYSIALTILALASDAAELDIRVLATDIDPAMLRDGAVGNYGETAMKPVSRDMKARWFFRGAPEKGEQMWRVGDELRKLVAFRELNLMQKPWPMRGPFQAIFCRNVLMYFDGPTQADVLNRFVPLTAPGGHLYIGHSERLNNEAKQWFDTVQFTVHRRKPAMRHFERPAIVAQTSKEPVRPATEGQT